MRMGYRASFCPKHGLCARSRGCSRLDGSRSIYNSLSPQAHAKQARAAQISLSRCPYDMQGMALLDARTHRPSLPATEAAEHAPWLLPLRVSISLSPQAHARQARAAQISFRAALLIGRGWPCPMPGRIVHRCRQRRLRSMRHGCSRCSGSRSACIAFFPRHKQYAPRS